MTAATTDYGNATRIVELCRIYLRAPVDCSSSGGVVTFNFVPALSVQEEATFARIVNLSKSLIQGITADEWAAIQPDIDGLVAYQNLANPTLAQTVLAVKAQSRILRAILKN